MKVRKLVMVVVAAVFACGVNGQDLRWDLLWDQWGTPENGWISQDFETAYDCYDCWAADDFRLPDHWPGAYLHEIYWYAWFTNGHATVRGVNFYIWPQRADGKPDFYNLYWTETGLIDQTLYSGENYCYLAWPCALRSGTTYFLGIQVQMDAAGCGLHLWTGQAREYHGQDFMMINPNGCLGGGSDWFAPVPGYEANFRLYGFVPEPGMVSLGGVLVGAGALWLRRR